MARYFFTPQPPQGRYSTVRFDTASGSATPAAQLSTVDGSRDFPGAVISRPNVDSTDNLPPVLGPDGVSTLYEKTLDISGGVVGAPVTLTGYLPTTTGSGGSGSPSLPVGPFGRHVPITDRPGNTGSYGLSTGPRNTRTRHKLLANALEIRLVFQNWQAGQGGNGNSENSGANAIVVTAAVEVKPGNATFAQLSGTTIPVTFGGASSATIAVDGYIVSDPIFIAGVKGDYIYVRTHETGTSIVSTCKTDPAILEGIDTSATDEATTGTITEQAATGCGPAAIIGVPPSGTTVPWVACVGDSLGNGAGDTSDFGFLIRWLNTLGVPAVNVTRPGEAGSAFTALTTSRRRRQFLGAPPYAICEYGRNDVSTGASLATVQATLLSIWTELAARGAKVLQTTISPKTTSTDSFLTTANQTADASEPVRVSLNAWIRAGSPIDPTTKAAVAVGTSNALTAGGAGHPLAVLPGAALGYLEVANTMETAPNSGLWKVVGTSATGNTTSGSASVVLTAGAVVTGDAIVSANFAAANYPFVKTGGSGTVTMSQNATATTTGVAITSTNTADGTHPSQNMHIAMAAALPATNPFV